MLTLAYVFTGIWAALLIGSLIVAIRGETKYGVPASVASGAAMVVSLVLTGDLYLSIFATQNPIILDRSNQSCCL